MMGFNRSGGEVTSSDDVKTVREKAPEKKLKHRRREDGDRLEYEREYVVLQAGFTGEDTLVNTFSFLTQQLNSFRTKLDIKKCSAIEI